MAITLEKKLFHRQRVINRLIDKIQDGKLLAGEKLPSIKKLASTFDVSVFTIHQSLEELENQGYVTKRHGYGTIVNERPDELQMSNLVVSMMDIHGHIFSHLNTALAERMSELSMTILPVNTNCKDRADRIKRALLSDSEYFVIHGNIFFPYQLLEQKSCRNKTVFGVINWEPPKKSRLSVNVHRILLDFQHGGRLVADYLAEQKHRKVLIIGTENMVREAIADEPYQENNCGFGFVRQWLHYGYEVETLVCSGEDYHLDEDKFWACLDQTRAPTAIFGLMDIAAWKAQWLLMQHRPGLLETLTMIGFGDTPWSQAALPPISTVSLNVDAIAAETVAAIRSVKDGGVAAPYLKIVKPELVIR